MAIVKAGVCILVLFFTVTGGIRSGEFGNESLAQSWNVDADYPTTGNTDIDLGVQEWLAESIREHITEYGSVGVNPRYPGGVWDMKVEYVTSMPSEKVVCFVFETMIAPSGAAHPMSRVDVLSFDAERGERIGLDDLFANPEAALRIMAGRAREIVLREFEVTAPELAGSLSEDSWFADGFEPNRKNYAAMVLVPDGVLVVFQKYQILPYVYGFPEALFTLDMLEAAGPRYELWGRNNAPGSGK